MAEKKLAYHYGLGRRKAAVARVRLLPGRGLISVNGQTAAEYFGLANLAERPQGPLGTVNKLSAYDVSARVQGGGKSGQADACCLAVAKALAAVNPEWRPTLRKAGYLVGDSRVKERKKYGLKRARKAPQFTKR